MEKPSVGFIGLGIMGEPMAGHILAAGYPLVVYNRTRSKTEGLASQGAGVAATPAEAAEKSEVIITMVSDSPDVEAVICGPGGVIETVRSDSVVIDMSTVSPQLEKELAARLREKQCWLVDAPVSGGDTGARAATLAIMAGGDRAAFERVKPLLRVMGKSVTYCGGSGSGQLTKLCNQILVSTTLLGVCEALLLARKNDLDPAVMIEAVAGGAAGSWQLSNLGPKIVEGDFAPGFMIDLIQKDLRLVMETAASSHVPLISSSVVRQLFSAAQAAGDGREGTQALARVLERMTQLAQG